MVEVTIAVAVECDPPGTFDSRPFRVESGVRRSGAPEGAVVR